jgi:hypothetical protein
VVSLLSFLLVALSLDEHGNCEIGDSEQIAGHETGNIQEAYSIVMGVVRDTYFLRRRMFIFRLFRDRAVSIRRRYGDNTASVPLLRS